MALTVHTYKLVLLRVAEEYAVVIYIRGGNRGRWRPAVWLHTPLC